MQFGQNLDQRRAAAVARLYDAVDATAEAIAGRYPRVEKDSWPQKEADARAILDGGAGPMVELEAAHRGVPPEVLAGMIVGRADAFRLVAAHMAGIRAAGEAGIAAAESAGAVMEALDAALAQLAALAP